MQEYIRALVQRFDNAEHLARFMGVSIHTVWSWSCGRGQPTGANLRMLQVLGVLAIEAPHILAALTGKQAATVKMCKPIVLLPPLQPVTQHVSTATTVAPSPRFGLTHEQIAERDVRNAAYWAAVDAGEQPPEPIEVQPVAIAPLTMKLYGRTREEWQAEWADVESEAIDRLTADQLDKVRDLIGK